MKIRLNFEWKNIEGITALKIGLVVALCGETAVKVPG